VAARGALELIREVSGDGWVRQDWEIPADANTSGSTVMQMGKLMSLRGITVVDNLCMDIPASAVKLGNLRAVLFLHPLGQLPGTLSVNNRALFH
jgi:hypothetical protein